MLRRLPSPEFAALLLGALALATAFACAAVAEWREIQVLQYVAGILFLATLATTGLSALFLLFQRRWMAAGVMLFLFPIFFIGGLFGLFLSSVAGRVLADRPLAPARLPLPQEATAALESTARRMAAALSSASGVPWSARAAGVVFNGSRRETRWEFTIGSRAAAFGVLNYRQTSSGSWERQSYYISGDLEPSLRKRCTALLAEFPLKDMPWPVPPEGEHQFIEAGHALAEGISSAAFGPQDRPWQLKQVELILALATEQPSRVAFQMEKNSQSQKRIWLCAEFQWDGRALHFLQATAGDHDSSTQKHGQEAEASITQWLRDPPPPFRQIR